ncbi:DinB family protein [Pseudomonas sp. 681]|uniref:DinB family protein n=1 Tax=Pseudomonas fungipugnans TaxID=3024217 RepID=A0ABT6QWJ4_9PSED|nr:DinB family protein [Pseudomonas sp. 681]MDI2595264.1 DinB family protein [Pseudomonas sp. 681]
MSASPLLGTLFGYHAWANRELLKKMEGFDPVRHKDELHSALRLVNHAHLVSRIFVAHLTGKAHGFAVDNPTQTPSLAELSVTVAATDRWYIEYVESVTPQQLCESVAFVFTDGDHGCMSREEMLTHVVTHAGYHRGEVGQIMKQLSIELPWDTFAVYLHRAEPSRRSNAL